MKLAPARSIKGRLQLPGDKSISHRAALIAAQATGMSRLSNFATSRDCGSTITCLQQLGVRVELAKTDCLIHGTGSFRAPAEPLDCGNSGSTMRMLTGILARQPFNSELVGDESLSIRPMRRVIEPLAMMGARITSRDGKPPLIIEGVERLCPINYVLPVASAQVKSAILLAAIQTDGHTEVIEPTPTRDHTERLFNAFGVTVNVTPTETGGNVISLDGPGHFSSRDMTIPGDISSAAYLIAAATLLPGSDLTLEDVGLNPTRSAFLSVFRQAGADVATNDLRMEGNEPLGTIHVRGSGSQAHDARNVVLGPQLIPSLIDELPLLAVAASQWSGEFEIRDARELRFKESDRIAATVHNLRAMGAAVVEFEDGLRVVGPTKLHGATLDSFADHRIAMSFAVAAMVADGPTELRGAECVDISFPGFFEILRRVVQT